MQFPQLPPLPSFSAPLPNSKRIFPDAVPCFFLSGRSNLRQLAMPLTATQIAQFKQDGYLVLRGLAPPDLRERMRAVTLEHLQRAVPPLEFEAELGYPGAPPSLDAPGGQTVRRLQGAFARGEAFRARALNPALISDLRQMLGEPVSLALAHHNCIMTKFLVFGFVTGWHCVFCFWVFVWFVLF